MTMTETVHVPLGERAYDVRIGAGLLERAGAEIAPLLHRKRVVVVSDATVAAAHLRNFEAALSAEGIGCASLELPPGEATKCWAQLERVVEWLLEQKVERRDVVVALGGGVIGDLVGFAAAVLRRGVRFVQVPTSLLAQVDSSVGGKTGINTSHGKNLVGAFHQPTAVMVDVESLATLDERDYLAGLAEVVKYGAIRDADFIDWLEDNVDPLLQRRAETLEVAVASSARHKIDVVEADEREAGQRALLNFGHTFGHAIETATGYGRYRHGEAVAIGMHLAGRLSARLGMIAEADADRLTHLLASLGLPTDPPADVEAKELLAHMQLDKKNRGGRIRLILLDALGAAIVRDDIEPNLLLELLES